MPWMEVLEKDLFIAREKAGDLLVLRSGVEVGPIEIRGKPRPPLLEPGAAISSGFRAPEHPGAGERSEAGRLTPVRWGLHEDATMLDVRQVGSSLALSDRVSLVTGAPPAVLPDQRHAAERIGIRSSRAEQSRTPLAVADDNQTLA